ncbi:hypothetical protein GCM10010360_31890 [Streptomyces nogalater]
MFELRLLIARQRSEPNRKLTIRSRSLPAASARTAPVRDGATHPRLPPHTTIRPLRAVRRGRIFGRAPGRGGLIDPGEGIYAPGAPTGLPSGETAYQVPPTP